MPAVFQEKHQYLSDHFCLDDAIDKIIHMFTFNNNSRYLCVILAKLASSAIPSV